MTSKSIFRRKGFQPISWNSNISKAYQINEKEKKRAYNERVQEIEQGTFTPLVFSAMGGMSRECDRFYKRLCELLADKRKVSSQQLSQWVRRKYPIHL